MCAAPPSALDRLQPHRGACPSPCLLPVLRRRRLVAISSKRAWDDAGVAGTQATMHARSLPPPSSCSGRRPVEPRAARLSSMFDVNSFVFACACRADSAPAPTQTLGSRCMNCSLHPCRVQRSKSGLPVGSRGALPVRSNRARLLPPSLERRLSAP